MKKPRFTEQQIAVAVRQAEHGTAAGDDLPQQPGPVHECADSRDRTERHRTRGGDYRTDR